MDQSKPDENSLHELELLRRKYSELKADHEKNLATQKKSEDALRQSEHKFFVLFEKSAYPASLSKFNGTIVNVNEAFEHEFGFKKRDVIGKTSSDLGISPDAEVREQIYRRLNEMDSVRNQELVLFMKSGEKRYYESNIDKIYIDGEEYLLNTTQNISEYKRAENKLKENFDLIRIAGEKAKLGGWNVILKENRAYWSDEVAAIHEMPAGYSPLVEDGIKFYAPEWRDKITKVFTLCATQGIPYDEEMEILTATEKRVWVRTIGEAVRDEKGNVYKVQGAFQDITFRKQAEKELKNSEARYKAIFESTGTATLIVDDDSTILLANNECYEIFGYDPEQLFGQKWTQFVAPESVQEMLRNHQLRRKNAQLAPPKYEVVLLNKKGEKRIAILNVNMIPGTKQSVVSMLDITKRKQAEEELKNSKNSLEEYFENDISADYVVSVSGEIFSCNKTFLNLFGFEKKLETEKFNITGLFKNPEDRKQMIRLVKNLRKVENHEVEFISKDGKPIFALINAIGIFNEKDKLEKIRGYVVDITKQKEIERELQNSEEKYRRFFEDDLTGNYHTTLDGKILTCNNAFVKMLKYKNKEEIYAINTSELYFGNSNRVKFLNKLKAEKKLHNSEFRLKAQDGSTVDIKENVVGVFDNSGELKEVIGYMSDITEQKKAERLIQISEKKYKDLSETLNAITWEYDLMLDKWNYVSPQSTSLLGYLPEEWKNFEWWAKNIYHEDRKSSVDFCISESKMKRDHVFEYRFTKKDGNVIWLRDNVVVIVEDNEPKFLRGIMTEITEQKKAQYELRESEEKYRMLFANNPQPMWIYDLETLAFLEVNEAAVNHYGFTKEEFLSMTLKNIRPVEDIPALLENINNTSSGFDTAGNWRHLKKNGEIIDVEITSNSILFNDRRARHIMVNDITERKFYETELLKLSRAVEQSPNSIIITDLEGKIKYINPKALAITGYSEEELIGKNPRIFNSGEKPKHEYEQLWHTILSGKEWIGEFHNKKKNGELYWESASISPILNEKLEIINYVAIKVDITERKNFIEDLKIAKENAEESDRLKSAFLANMSHEIRTPMNGILGFTNLLLEPDLSSEQKEEFINIVQQSGQRMLNTVTDIVEISKIEAGLVQLNQTETDINGRMEELFRFFQPEAEKKGILLTLEMLLPPADNYITTDQNKLDSILSNLIKNAIKYTVSGTIQMGWRQKDSCIEFYIKDTGIGIPLHRQEAIFERFMQADIADTRVFEGSGLGLAISKSYVEMLGGKIWVESREGNGSTFYFTLPLTNFDKEKNVVLNKIPCDNANGKVKFELHCQKILIAEDDKPSRNYLTFILSEFGAELLEAGTGIETVELCRNNTDLDLILMDIQMPEMNGYDATREIRKFNTKVIIIAQTAFALSGDREKAIEAGCNDYIAKPIKKTELEQLIQKHIKKLEIN